MFNDVLFKATDSLRATQKCATLESIQEDAEATPKMEEAANSIGLKVLTGPEWQGIGEIKIFK